MASKNIVKKIEKADLTFFAGTSAVEEAPDFNTKAQGIHKATGLPLWKVSVLMIQGEEAEAVSEPIELKIASAVAPKIVPLTVLVAKGDLIYVPWISNNRVSHSYTLVGELVVRPPAPRKE